MQAWANALIAGEDVKAVVAELVAERPARAGEAGQQQAARVLAERHKTMQHVRDGSRDGDAA